MKNNFKILYGRRVAEEYLKNDHSPKIHKLILSESNQQQVNEKLIQLAKVRSIPIEILPPYKFADLTAHIPHTQGVLIHVEKKILSKNYIFQYCQSPTSQDLIIMLDHIEDSNNLGAILRIAGFYGVKMVIAPKDRAVSLNPAVEKIASGALSFVQYVEINNLTQAIEFLKKQDYWVVGTSLNASSQEVSKFEFPAKSLLVIGNEHKGLSRLVEKNCDFLIKIDGKGPIQSLNAAISTAIFTQQFFINQKKSKKEDKIAN